MRARNEVGVGMKLKHAGRTIRKQEAENTRLSSVAKECTPLGVHIGGSRAFDEFAEMMADDVTGRPAKQLACGPVHIHVESSVIGNQHTKIETLEQLHQVCVPAGVRRS